MPIAIKIDKDSGIVHSMIEGRISADELIEKLQDLIDHPDYRPGLNGIADLRKIDKDMFSEDVFKVAKLMIENRDKIGASKTAVLVSKEVTFGMTRVFQALSEQSSVKTEIFWSMEEALQWLGADK
jgi:hypothetical protein